MVLILKISSIFSAAAVLKANLAKREGPTSNLVKLLDIVQMVTMNFSSEDCTLIIEMVLLRTRWTKSILINQTGQIYLILVCGLTIKSRTIQSLLVEAAVKRLF